MVYCVRTVLIILTQNDQSNLNVNESVSALMLFASFDLNIHVLFKDAALSLLAEYGAIHDLMKPFLKPANKMVESFEFYDIEHLYVLQKDQAHPLVKNSKHHLLPIDLTSDFIHQFDHIITW